MTFTVPSELTFSCSECSRTFRLITRELSEVLTIHCPYCASSMYWLDCVEPRVKAELLQQVRESLREIVKKVEEDVQRDKKEVDEAVLRLLLSRMIKS